MTDWHQYFSIKYQNLPPETIGVPTPGESHCTVWNSQKSIVRPPAAAACWADLCRVVSSSCIPAAPRRRAKIVPPAQFSRGTELRKHRFSGRLTPVPPERSRRNARTPSTRSPVCPADRNRCRPPAAFLAVSDGTVALARRWKPRWFQAVGPGEDFRWLLTANLIILAPIGSNQLRIAVCVHHSDTFGISG